MFQKVCTGVRSEPSVCEYIDDCKLCINYGIDSDYNELYGLGRDTPAICCKRDCLGFKPMTEPEFIELYKQIKGDSDTVCLQDMIDFGKSNGLIKE